MTPPEPFRYRRHFPWLHIFRAFGIALALRQLLLSGLALATIALGQYLFTGFGLSEPAAPQPARGRTAQIAEILNESPQAPPRTENTPPNEPDQWQQRFGAWPKVLFAPSVRPWGDVLFSAIPMLSPTTSRLNRVLALLQFAWAISVWSLFGLALCRLAAIQVARDESGSFRRATQYGVTRWKYAVAAPLIPLAAAMIVLFGVMCLVVPSHLPLIGHVWLYAASPALLAGGCAVIVLLLTAALGWPLMIAAIAVDDCDGFGGLSRAYSFCTGRPAHAIVFATVAVAFASFLTHVTSTLFATATLLARTTAAIATSHVTHLETVSHGCGLVAHALEETFAISLFWTSVTLVYMLLRAAVDQRPLDHLAPDETERPPRTPLPVVGIPATDAANSESGPEA